MLALFAAIRLRPIVSAALIGSLAGVAAGFKIHGFLYILPIAMMLLASVKGFRKRAVLSAVGAGCAVIFVLLPFYAKASSLEGYLLYLKLAARHGVSLELIRKNCVFALAIFAPMAVIWYWRRPTLELRERWLIAGLILSMAITVIVAAKPGSGPHHFFPFVPLCLYGVVVLLDSPSTEAPRITTIVFLLMLAAYSPGLILQVGHTNYYRNAQTELVKVAEIRALLVTYPDAQIGVSDRSHYADTYYKFLSVLRGRSAAH